MTTHIFIDADNIFCDYNGLVREMIKQFKLRATITTVYCANKDKVPDRVTHSDSNITWKLTNSSKSSSDIAIAVDASILASRHEGKMKVNIVIVSSDKDFYYLPSRLSDNATFTMVFAQGNVNTMLVNNVKLFSINAIMCSMSPRNSRCEKTFIDHVDRCIRDYVSCHNYDIADKMLEYIQQYIPHLKDLRADYCALVCSLPKYDKVYRGDPYGKELDDDIEEIKRISVLAESIPIGVNVVMNRNLLANSHRGDSETSAKPGAKLTFEELSGDFKYQMLAMDVGVKDRDLGRESDTTPIKRNTRLDGTHVSYPDLERKVSRIPTPELGKWRVSQSVASTGRNESSRWQRRTDIGSPSRSAINVSKLRESLNVVDTTPSIRIDDSKMNDVYNAISQKYTITYSFSRSGPDHNPVFFCAAVAARGKEIHASKSDGRSKKEAKALAKQALLEKLENALGESLTTEVRK